jgi:hypothetical protein
VAGESRGSLISLVVILAVAGIVLVTQTGPALGLGTVLVAALVLLSFLHTEFGLHLILISMLLSPEIVVGAAGIVLGKPEMKGDALVVRMEDLVLVAITAAWLARLLVFRVMGLLRKTPLNPPIAAYTVIAVLATLLGFWAGKVPPVPGFFFVAKYIEFFILFYVMATHLTNEAQLTRLLRTMWGTCIVACVIALAQIPTGQRVSAPFEGPQGEPNTFGGYLVLMFALALGQGLTLAKPKQRLRWLALAGLILVPLLFTLSRTSWLAAIPMLLTLILLSPRRHILIAAVLLVIVGGAAITPDAVLERINYTFYDPEDRGDVWVAGTQLDTSTTARFASGLRIWREGLYVHGCPVLPRTYGDRDRRAARFRLAPRCARPSRLEDLHPPARDALRGARPGLPGRLRGDDHPLHRSQYFYHRADYGTVVVLHRDDARAADLRGRPRGRPRRRCPRAGALAQRRPHATPPVALSRPRGRGRIRPMAATPTPSWQAIATSLAEAMEALGYAAGHPGRAGKALAQYQEALQAPQTPSPSAE